MTQKTPKTTSKDRPLRQLSAWLEAANIPVTRADTEDDWDLTIRTQDGNDFEIHVTKDLPRLHLLLDCAIVPAKDLSDPDSLRALFHEITDAAGYGRPAIVNRGPAPEGKLNYHHDFDAVVFRHCELRRVPNPSSKVLDHYLPTMRGAAHFFHSTNKAFCKRFGYDLEDLLQYARVWTCNYHGLYEIPADRVKASDNEKLLFRYLQQRFAEFRKIAMKKMKNCVPDYDTAATGLYERPWSPLVDFESEVSQQAAGSLLAAPEDETEPQAVEYSVRRAQAIQSLSERFQAMSHDQMVSILQSAIENELLAPDARDEASRQLKKHAKTCDACSALSCEGLEEDEEAAGVDAV